MPDISLGQNLAEFAGKRGLTGTGKPRKPDDARPSPSQFAVFSKEGPVVQTRRSVIYKIVVAHVLFL